jgi:hypothetical protein
VVDAVAVFLGLFSTGIFVAHAVDAYAHAAKKPDECGIGLPMAARFERR